MGKNLGAALGILNGVAGDYLHATNNGLAIDMAIVRGVAGPRVAVFVHGLMCTEDVWTLPDGSDYGSLLARDVGYSPLYVRFNTGRRVSDNGAELARLLEELTAAHPVIEEILVVGFSMGGLVARNATHVAANTKMRWLSLVHRVIYIGTPHLGSPWERIGRTVTSVLRRVPDPYAQLVSELGDLRSAGIKDLGDPAHPYPLLPQLEHCFIAGFVDPWIAEHLGDVMVPLASGTNGLCARPHARALAPEHVRLMPGLAHMTLAHHPDVYAHIRTWCEGKADQRKDAA